MFKHRFCVHLIYYQRSEQRKQDHFVNYKVADLANKYFPKCMAHCQRISSYSQLNKIPFSRSIFSFLYFIRQYRPKALLHCNRLVRRAGLHLRIMHCCLPLSLVYFWHFILKYSRAYLTEFSIQLYFFDPLHQSFSIFFDLENRHLRE